MNFAYVLFLDALSGAIASAFYILKISPFVLLGMLLFRLAVGCIRKQIALIKLLQTPQQIDLLKVSDIQELNTHTEYDLQNKLQSVNTVLRKVNESQL